MIEHKRAFQVSRQTFSELKTKSGPGCEKIVTERVVTEQ